MLTVGDSRTLLLVWTCDKCPARFAFYSDLRKHISDTHAL